MKLLFKEDEENVSFVVSEHPEEYKSILKFKIKVDRRIL